jgi:ubiquinone/menaquinone biosynthesis C-methylase UbiE
MSEKKLIISTPKTVDEINQRKKSKSRHSIKIARKFDSFYFDGDRKYGYGGYSYDGRWRKFAGKLIQEYSLNPQSRILDIGSAKGFLIKDLMNECPGLQGFGVDISKYALRHVEKEVVGRVHLASATELPFGDNSFDLVVSINTLHNLTRNGIKKALSEINRVGTGKSYIVVDSYWTVEQKKRFNDWVLTAKFHAYPSEWLSLFRESNYTGDYDWTIV